jgi:TolB protein
MRTQLLLFPGLGPLLAACMQPPAVSTMTSTPELTATSASTPTVAFEPSVTPPPTATATATAIPTSVGGGSGQIAFVSDRGGDREIYLLQIDGSGLANLTDSPAPDYNPHWSPDGSKLAFETLRHEPHPDDCWQWYCDSELYVLDILSGNAINVTNHMGVQDTSPTWSPDGTRLAFVYRMADHSEIYLAAVDGSSPSRLSPGAVDQWTPEWSPVGDRILFGSYPEGGLDIFLIAPDGTDLLRLTTYQGFDAGGVWSPDGKQVAFYSDRSGNYDIYIAGVSGSELTQLTTDPALDISPLWSPDGTRIACLSSHDDPNPEHCRECIFSVYVVGIDGAGLLRLSDGISNCTGLSWSPDGAYLAYAAHLDASNWEIMAADVLTGEVTNLTNDPASDTQPAWRP